MYDYCSKVSTVLIQYYYRYSISFILRTVLFFIADNKALLWKVSTA
jgi:hypothetical protein